MTAAVPDEVLTAIGDLVEAFSYALRATSAAGARARGVDLNGWSDSVRLPAHERIGASMYTLAAAIAGSGDPDEVMHQLDARRYAGRAAGLADVDAAYAAHLAGR